MVSLLRIQRMILALTMLTSLLVLIGCSSGPSVQPDQIHLVVGGKEDVEAQLLKKMYVLLIRHAGFDVEERAKLGPNDVVFNAINSGKIDLYPEFTTDGLVRLHLATTHNAQQDYQNIKQGYESKYHIRWLAVAPLNDTYAICTSKATADQLGVSSISQLAQIAAKLTIVTPPDGEKDPNVLPGLQPTYGIKFDKVRVLTEEQTFQAVIDSQADLNICYTTSPLISQSNFVELNDDKHSFPDYFPAPIVRDDALRKAPQIESVLNQLAPKLTTDVSVMLQRQVFAGFSVTDVATTWLKSQGLL